MCGFLLSLATGTTRQPRPTALGTRLAQLERGVADLLALGDGVDGRNGEVVLNQALSRGGHALRAGGLRLSASTDPVGRGAHRSPLQGLDMVMTL